MIQTSQTWSVLTCQTHTQSSLKAFWYLHDIFLIFFLQKICCCLVVLFFFFNWPPPDGLTRWSHQNTQPADSLGSLFFFLYYMYKIYLSLSFPYHTTAHTHFLLIFCWLPPPFTWAQRERFICARAVFRQGRQVTNHVTGLCARSAPALAAADAVALALLPIFPLFYIYI